MPIAGWEEMGDMARIAAVAASAECAGMSAEQIADYINTPQEASILIGGASLADCLDGLSDATVVKLSNSGNAYQSSKTTANAAGLAVWTRLSSVGHLDMVPGSKGRSVVDAAVAAGFLTAADLNTLIELASTPVMWCMVHAPVEEGGFAWLDPAAAVTPELVRQAIGG